MVSTQDSSFAATFIVDGEYTPPPPSATPGLASLIPPTQEIDAMSTRRTQNVTQSLPPPPPKRDEDSGSERRGDSESEADDEQEQRARQQALQNRVEADDLTLDDDAAAHSKGKHTRRTSAATAASPAPSKVQKRAGKWNDERDLQLLEAVLAWVKAHGGQLPGAARTGRGVTAPASWKEIATATPHISSLADKDAAARAASSRWISLRAGVAVRHRHKQR
jgi:hypothetical protein